MEPQQTTPEGDNAAVNPAVPAAPSPSVETETKTEPTIELSENPIMAAISYLGPLVLIPFLTQKDNPFIFFHIKQGLVLFAFSLIVYVASGFLWFLFPIFMLIHFGIFILAVIGIVNALQKKEKELPLIGKFASHIKI